MTNPNEFTDEDLESSEENYQHLRHVLRRHQEATAYSEAQAQALLARIRKNMPLAAAQDPQQNVATATSTVTHKEPTQLPTAQIIPFAASTKMPSGSLSSVNHAVHTTTHVQQKPSRASWAWMGSTAALAAAAGLAVWISSAETPNEAASQKATETTHTAGLAGDAAIHADWMIPVTDALSDEGLRRFITETGAQILANPDAATTDITIHITREQLAQLRLQVATQLAPANLSASGTFADGAVYQIRIERR